MIVSRTPLRISLGGGGTDLPFYCERYGSSLVCSAITKYIYITVSWYPKGIKLNYSRTEVVQNVDQIEHPLIREALKLVGIRDCIEIHSIADVPSGTGLGSSGAFLVGLLNALYFYKGEIVSKYKLAEDTSHITMEILKEPCGKQDQYAAAFGNLLHLKIATNQRVNVSPINMTYENVKKLQENLLMFYTGFQRSANDVLAEQDKLAKKDEKAQKTEEQKAETKTTAKSSAGSPAKTEEKKRKESIFDQYHEIKKIGNESLKCLEKGDLRRFGEWMNIHWEFKKRISGKMSNPQIDKWYAIALANGALGGKIIGAGGGGYLLLYVEKNHDRLTKALEKEGLVKTDFRFDFDGSRIVYDGRTF
jgi:D-glycero-alpha-D-manno-heptose-7-phosphate kinase